MSSSEKHRLHRRAFEIQRSGLSVFCRDWMVGSPTSFYDWNPRVTTRTETASKTCFNSATCNRHIVQTAKILQSGDIPCCWKMHIHFFSSYSAYSLMRYWVPSHHSFTCLHVTRQRRRLPQIPSRLYTLFPTSVLPVWTKINVFTNSSPEASQLGINTKRGYCKLIKHR